MGEREEPRDDVKTESVEESSEAVEAEVVEPEVVDTPVEAEVIDVQEIIEPTELEKTKNTLEQTQARLRTVSKAYTDLQNEMTAFRSRMEAQSKIKAERQAFEAVGAFLEPVQNLKRSLETPGEDMGSLLQGLAIVQKQFMDALTKLGLEEVPGVGAPFDPKFHEALAVTPVTEAEQDGKVLMVHQGGYMVKGKVLQAAQVVIGKHEAPAAEA